MRDNPVIRRLLTLRRFPGFAEAELGDIATIAENVVETSFAAGQTVAPPGRVAAIHLIVDGRLRAGDREWGQNQLFGAFEVMADRRTSLGAVAVEPTHTLRLAASDFAEVLEDSYSILASARRMLARKLLALEASQSDVIPRGPVRVEAELAIHPLGMVDRLILLRQQMAFAAARAQALATLAQASEDIQFPAGAVLAERGQPATRGLIVLGGAVQSTRADGQVIVLGPGEGIGGLEMLAELPSSGTFTAVTPVRALSCPASALFDVMEDHTDFALGILSRLAGAAIDLDVAFPTIVDHSARPTAPLVH
jgi:CRP-like cAMP-binding protein